MSQKVQRPKPYRLVTRVDVIIEGVASTMWPHVRSFDYIEIDSEQGDITIINLDRGLIETQELPDHYLQYILTHLSMENSFENVDGPASRDVH